MEVEYYLREVAEILEKFIKQQRVQVAKVIMQQVAKYRQLQKIRRGEGVKRGQAITQEQINFMKPLAMAVLDEAGKGKLQR